MITARRTGPLWTQLERDAHRMVLDLFEHGQALDDAEHIATRVLAARGDVTASMREEYVDALAATIHAYVAVLAEKTRP